MTTTKTSPARARAAQRAEPSRWTVLGDIALELSNALEIHHRIKFPSTRFADDPLAFFRLVLGLEPWSEQQRVIEAVRTHDRVAWKSGRRVGKSYLVAGLALWFYCSFEYARVIMTSTTARQVDSILWRALSMLRAKSGRCHACNLEDPKWIRIPRPCEHSAMIDGEIGQLARTGLKSTDDLYREIWGFTAKESEAVQGLAGPRMLVIADEASGIPEPIFEAFDGNSAGGMKMILTGNPTKTVGRFFDAFNDPRLRLDLDERGVPVPGATGWWGLTTASTMSPNVISGTTTIEALATREWIARSKKEWGEDSPLYRVHVLGEFATNEDGKIFSVDRIRSAEERHEGASLAGRLFLGVDPAGATGMGDESCFTARRGLKEIPTSADGAGKLVKLGLDTDAHVVEIVRLLGVLTKDTPREVPVVVIDRSGKIGSELYGSLLAHQHEHERTHRRIPFEVVGVNSSAKAIRQPTVYDTVRDELCASLEQAFRDGAAILEDAKCSAELHCLEWRQVAAGRLKVTPKDEIRKLLGRSPDRYDALALAYWDPAALGDRTIPDTATVDGVTPAARKAAAEQRAREDEENDEYEMRAESRINPYGGRR